MKLSNRTQRLEGERVELLRHIRANYPLYGEWYGDPEIWHLTSWAAEPLGAKAVQRLFEQRESSITDDSFAIHRKGQRHPIGIVSLMNISEVHASADLSIIVGRQGDRDQGYGSEAIEALLEYSFESLGLHRVGLSVFDFNALAISTYEKLGFREEGRLRQAIKRDHAFHDAILMSILRPECRKSRS